MLNNGEQLSMKNLKIDIYSICSERHLQNLHSVANEQLLAYVLKPKLGDYGNNNDKSFIDIKYTYYTRMAAH